jgi:hypothetical protein
MTCGRLIRVILAFTLATGMAAAANADSASMKSWQMTRLFEPTQADRKSEDKGRVMIYDRLTDKDVERALDEQFDRLEHVMFTRVIVTDESGEPRRSEDGAVVTESDDGCD